MFCMYIEFYYFLNEKFKKNFISFLNIKVQEVMVGGSADVDANPLFALSSLTVTTNNV